MYIGESISKGDGLVSQVSKPVQGEPSGMVRQNGI